jgi:hypothetical protein
MEYPFFYSKNTCAGKNMLDNSFVPFISPRPIVGVLPDKLLAATLLHLTIA